MSVIDFIAVFSLMLTSFALGYAFGKDHRNSRDR